MNIVTRELRKLDDKSLASFCTVRSMRLAVQSSTFRLLITMAQAASLNSKLVEARPGLLVHRSKSGSPHSKMSALPATRVGGLAVQPWD